MSCKSLYGNIRLVIGAHANVPNAPQMKNDTKVKKPVSQLHFSRFVCHFAIVRFYSIFNIFFHANDIKLECDYANSF